MASVETGWPSPLHGIENEYTLQPPRTKGELMAQLGPAVRAAGLEIAEDSYRNGHFLSNGGRIHPELQAFYRLQENVMEPRELGEGALAEYGMPEAGDAYWATAAQEAGDRVTVGLLGDRVTNLYLRSGYAHQGRGDQATGHHESYLGRSPHPQNRGPHHASRVALGSYFATRHVLAGAGMVGNEFQLSQKGPHLQEVQPPRGDSMAFTPQARPMLRFHVPGDTHRHYAGDYQYRTEYLGGDALHSRLATFMALGTTAGFLAAVDIAPRESRLRMMTRIMLDGNPLQILKTINTIETMHRPLRNINGETITAVGLQEACLEFTSDTAEALGLPLPPDQARAIELAWQTYAALRGVRSADDIGPLVGKLEWPSRLGEMLRLGFGPITRTNQEAVGFDLRWDGRKRGPGLDFWAIQPGNSEVVPDWMVNYCVEMPTPGTRAEQRVALARQLQREGHHNLQATWDSLSDGPETWYLRDPFGQDPPRYHHDNDL